ncbi:MAG: Ig-like domain-containing protein [Cyclobacteriaceae bacterium]
MKFGSSIFLKKCCTTIVCLIAMIWLSSSIVWAATCTTTAVDTWDCGTPTGADDLIVNHTATISGSLTITGSITVNSGGTLTITGLTFIQSSATITVNSGGILNFGSSSNFEDNAVVTINSGGTFNITGSLTADNAAVTNVNGVLDVGGIIISHQTSSINVSATGGLTVGSSYTLNNTASLTIASGGTTDITGSVSVNNSGVLSSYGQLDIGGIMLTATSSDITIGASSTVDVVSSITNNSIDAVIDGALNSTAGSFSNPGTITGSGIITYTGICTGSGTINGEASAVYCAGAGTIDLSTLGSLVVTNTNNSGAGSLRQAILDANANGGTDNIFFNIPGAGPHTIQPTSALPTVTDPVVIDGTTQSGAQCNTVAAPGASNAVLLIVLNGSSAGAGVSGLTITAGGSTVRGLVINNFTVDGIVLTNNGGNTIECNYIGTDVTGTVDLGNTDDGVGMGSGADNNIIGGTTPQARNLISGNGDDGVTMHSSASSNTVEGNFIGTDVTGTLDLGNTDNGVIMNNAATNNTVGGNINAARNIISGNDSDGVEIYGAGTTGNQVLGNYIGTDVNGTADIGNSVHGVFLNTSADGNTIGGTIAGSGNIISGNDSDGISSDGVDNLLIQGNHIGTNATGTLDLGNNGDGIDLINTTNSTIGGNTSATRNVISGNGDDGVNIDAGSGNSIQGNYIGLDVNGTGALGNSGDGILLELASTNNTVGGSSAGTGNFISANGSDGVEILDNGTSSNSVIGNYIGTDVSGAIDLGNSFNGVHLVDSSSINSIGGSDPGEGNLISGNNGSGILITGTATTGNSFEGNLIGTDAAGLADLGNLLEGILLQGGAANNTIGGTSAGARNVISGNNAFGIAIDGTTTTSNQVIGNYIGTDINGNAALANGTSGIGIINSAGNTIGGFAAGESNLISGNSGNGITIGGAGADNNTIQGNLIGTQSDGTSALGNGGDGILVSNTPANNLIGGTSAGAGNTIAHNTLSGVTVYANSDSIQILTNQIFNNGTLGIDLSASGSAPDGVSINDPGDGDSGGNSRLNFPVITTITQVGADVQVSFELDVPSGNYRVEFFDNPNGLDPSDYGEGESYLSFASVAGAPGSSHNVTLSGVAPNNVLQVTATATEDFGGSYGSTSEFSTFSSYPVAVDDIFNTNEDLPLSDDVLTNDSDPNADPLTVSLITDVTNGVLVLNGDGTFTYTPAANFNGSDSFVYEVCDDASPINNCAQATASIIINPVNDPPIAIDDSGETTNEDIPVISPVLTNDSDPDADPLTIVSVTQPTNGIVVNNGNGTITYTPFPNFSGVNAYTYTITDGNGGTSTATVTVTINPINDTPNAVLDIIATLEEIAVVIPVLSNDIDVDGDPITITGFTPATNGLVVDNGNDTYTYTPNTNFSGIDTFTYTITDSNGGFSTGTVTIVVAPINDGPQAIDDNANINEDTPALINVTGNDLDTEGDPLTVVIVTQGTSGTVVISGSNTVTYTPFPNFNGTDSFTYTIHDGNGGISTATVTIVVSAVNDDPVAVNDFENTPEDVAITIEVVDNDVDVDGDLLSITAVTQGSNGTVVNNGDGTVTYTPNANFNGSDTFTYTITDGNGGFATASVTVFVGPINDDPIANDDFDITKEDNAVTTNVLANDNDPPDNDPLVVFTITQPANGMVVNNGDGTVTYTPNLDFNGTDTYTYSITDGNGGTATATVTIIVQSRNDDPVAVLDITSTAEDTPVIIDVISNDFDVDGDAIRVQKVDNPANGTVVNNKDGTVTYTPDPNFTGVDTFNYTITDNRGGFSTAIISVFVGIANDPPTASGDVESTTEDTPVTTDVLSNDSDPDGDPLTIVVITQGSNGTVVDNGNGTITYTPNPNFTGADNYTYTITDGNGGTSTGTVTVVVNSTNDNPLAVDDIDGTNEDLPVTTDVLANDMDPEGASVFITSTTAGFNGTVTDNGNGTITYTPDPNFNGVDTYTYTITDGAGGTATATVTIFVDALNDPPVAEDDVASTPQNIAIVIAVLNNDFDVDGDALSLLSVATATNGSAVDNGDGTTTYTPNNGFLGIDLFTYIISDGNGTTATATVTVFVGINNNPPVANDDNENTDEDNPVTTNVLSNDSDPDSDPLVIASITQPANGTIVGNGNGTITYTPDPNYNGADSYTYTIVDNRGGTATATVNITVNPINDDPIAEDDFENINEDEPVIVIVLNNDSDPDGDPLSISGFTQGANGTVTDNGDGTLTYTPNGQFSGSDNFTYTINDGNGGSDGATVSITIATVNDAPLAVDDNDITDEDNPITTDVIANDSDPENDPLVISAVTQGSNGAVINNGDGTASYIPKPDFFGTDTYTYTITDGNGETASATVTITVNPNNDPPLAIGDFGNNTDEDTPIIINVLANDIDIDGTLDLSSIAIIVLPPNGNIVDNGDGTITYIPDPAYNGTDSLTYTVNDNNGATSNIATVLIVIEDINDLPVAVDDAVGTNEELTIAINVINNDTDTDGNIDPTSVGIAAFPLNGQIVVNGDGTITYTPDPNFAGIDSLAYTVDDDDGGTSNVATVIITVNNLNDPPIAIGDNFSTDEDTPLNIVAPGLVGNDIDPEGNTLTVTGFDNTSVGGGVVLVNGDGSFTFTPLADFNGMDSFTYTVADGNGGTDVATVTVVVNPINDNPVALDDSYSTDEDTSLNVAALGVLGNDSDIEGDTFTITNFDTNSANGGVVVVNADGSFSYNPAAGFVGLDTYTYVIDDGNGGTDTATVTITVIDLNDPPNAVDDSYNTDEEVTLIISDPLLGLLNNDSDPEGDNLTVSTTQVSGPGKGAVTLNANGTFTYTPNNDSTGIDTFIYQVCDDGNPSTCSQATVTITIDPINDAPVAVDDSYITVINTSINIAVPGLLQNDLDVDGDGIEVVDVVPVGTSGGTLLWNIDGSFDYAPPVDFIGTETYSYDVRDGNGGNATAGISIQVLPPNDPPVAEEDLIITEEDFEVSDNVLDNDSDPNGDDLTVNDTPLSGPSNGTLVLDADGAFTYTPNPGFRGTDSFVYEVCDDGFVIACSMATVVIEVTPFEGLVIYEGISPNSDDSNDVWVIEGIQRFPNNTVQIFNRWGNKVYEARGYNNLSIAWEGQSTKGIVLGNDMLPAGTYFYVLDIGDGSKARSGYIVLRR